jgi:hypothetical protein
MLLKLNPYRIAINPSILHSTAEDILSKADKIENLQAHLNWNPAPDILTKGFAPMKDSKKLLSYLKESKARRMLKEKRVAKGFHDFISPRKGLKGWWQKTWADGKEQRLLPTHEALAWLRLSPRYLLLVSLHDLLISYVSTSEPRRIDLKESTTYYSPIVQIILKNDLAGAEKIHTALSAPLSKVSPDSLIDYFSGYVLHYDRKKSSAFYLG